MTLLLEQQPGWCSLVLADSLLLSSPQLAVFSLLKCVWGLHIRLFPPLSQDF